MFGCCCEHVPYDAMVMVNIAHYVEERLLEMEERCKGSEKVWDIPLPEELVFTVDEKILNDVSQAKAQHLKVASDLQRAASTFTTFGKKLTKKEALHPDTFIRLALQLTYYRPHGCPGCGYETAMTRYFLPRPNRNCAIVYSGGCQVVPGQADPSASLPEHQQKMLEAFAKYSKMMKDCSHEKGFDRHPLLIAIEEGLSVPELFEDPLFSRSGGGGNFVLSTSLAGCLLVRESWFLWYIMDTDFSTISETTGLWWHVHPGSHVQRLMQES